MSRWAHSSSSRCTAGGWALTRWLPTRHGGAGDVRVLVRNSWQAASERSRMRRARRGCQVRGPGPQLPLAIGLGRPNYLTVLSDDRPWLGLYVRTVGPEPSDSPVRVVDVAPRSPAASLFHK